MTGGCPQAFRLPTDNHFPYRALTDRVALVQSAVTDISDNSVLCARDTAPISVLISAGAISLISVMASAPSSACKRLRRLRGEESDPRDMNWEACRILVTLRVKEMDHIRQGMDERLQAVERTPFTGELQQAWPWRAAAGPAHSL